MADKPNPKIDTFPGKRLRIAAKASLISRTVPKRGGRDAEKRLRAPAFFQIETKPPIN